MKIHLWDLAAGTLITKPGPMAVSCVAFTPDGKRLAALGYDGNVHLADARTGEEVLVLRGFGPPIGSGGLHPTDGLQPRRLPDRRPIRWIYLNLWDLGPRWGLAAEPGAGDLAGWLRRSRALAETGDAAGALAAAARARDDPGWRRVSLDRARRLPVSPRRLCAVRRTPWVGPWRPCPTTPRDGSTSAGCSGTSAGRRSRRRCERRAGPCSSGGSPARPTTRRPPRPWPSCSRRPTHRGGLDRPPARRDDLRRGHHTDPAARRLGPGRRAEPRRRHVHGRGHDRSSRDHGIAARGHPRPEPPAPGAGAGSTATSTWTRSACTPSPGASAPVPVHLSRACADYAEPMYGLKGVSGTLDSGPVHRLVDLAAGGPTSLGRLPDRPTDRDRCWHEVAGGAGQPVEVRAQHTGPVPPVGHEPAVPAVRTAA